MGGPVFDALRGDGSEAQKDRGCRFAGRRPGRCGVGRSALEGREEPWEIGIGLLPGLLLWGCSFLTEGKVGRGDGDMVLILGLFLGWRRCVVALCAACLLSALWAGIGLAAGRLKKDSKLPFAPFLLAAVALAGLSGF